VTGRKGLCVVVHWAATTATALLAVDLVPAAFSGPYAPAPGVVAAAGICLTGAALAPSTIRKAPQ
jgi:hypothetical protein